MSDIDSQTLAGYVRALGGQPVAHQRFRFELPLSETKRVVPELNKLNLRCEKVGERQAADVSGKMHSVAVIELSRRPTEKSDYQSERDLMSAIIR